MNAKNNKEQSLKTELTETCIKIQEGRLASSREAMLQAQETANEQPGSMGDKYESFREQMQIDRDMYARQYDESAQVLEVLRKIDALKGHDMPSLGAVVMTDNQNFFVSASLGKIETSRGIFIAISSQSPMFQAMAGTVKGGKFSFREKTFAVKEIF